MSTTNANVDVLQAMIDAARRIVFFTGAGISTESGIPDYRSPGTGLWNKIKPIEFQDFVASDDVRQESWRRRFASGAEWEDAKPNRGHRALAKLIADGKATTIITQNVDNLHQESGVSEERIVELHGNTRYAKCLSCALRYEIADLRRQFETLHRQDGDHLLRPSDAGRGDGAGAGGHQQLRPVHGHRLVAGGLSGGGISGIRQAHGRQARDRQSRSHAARRHRRLGVA